LIQYLYAASTQIYGGGSVFTQPYMDYFTDSFQVRPTLRCVVTAASRLLTLLLAHAQLVRRDDAIVCTYGGASHSLLFLMAKPDLVRHP
jgi:hypothetical protein